MSVNESWDDGGVVSGSASTPITSDTLSDAALAESLSSIQHSAQGGWATRLNERLSAMTGTVYDKPTLLVVCLLAIVSVALFGIGVLLAFVL